MDQVRADVASHSRRRSVVLAHGFVGGDHPPDECESERNVSIGGSALVPTSVFHGVDYVALGHLHRRQSPAPTITYSGTPLAYSFSEAGDTKSVSIVDLAADGSVTVTPVPTPVGRRLATVRATLDDLLTNPSFSEYEDAFLAVTLLDEIRPREPVTQLRSRFPHVLTLSFDLPTTTTSGASYTARLHGLDDHAIAERFVADVRGTPATEAEQALLRRAIEQARVASEADPRGTISEEAV
jgi:exonuclease SbcD